eukprot:1194377-Prorocentrum_minimum.AAC.5
MESYGRDRSSSPRREDRRLDRPPPIAKLCKDFANGRCTYANCRFSHDGSGAYGARDAIGGRDIYVDGDWYCTDCREHNFARREMCFKVSSCARTST